MNDKSDNIIDELAALEDDASFQAHENRGHGMAADLPVTEQEDRNLKSVGGARSTSPGIFEENCPACRGSGYFVSYSGRVVGKCFKCKGKGKVHFRTSPEARGKAKVAAQSKRIAKELEAKETARVWREANPAYSAFLDQNWDFPRSLTEALVKYGRLTDNQIAAIDKCLVSQAARDTARAEENKASAVAGLDLSSIPAGRYAVPDGDTRLKVMIRKPNQGNWKGWIFVSDAAEYGSRTNYGRQGPGKAYTGKIVAQLQAILANPLEAAVAYGRLTGTCCVCGRKLEDKASVEAGIGPICAKKF